MATDRATKTEGEAFEERTARRRLFALGAAGLGVVAGLGLRSNTAAAAHGSPVLGASSDPAEAAVRGDHHTSGVGVHGTSESGAGVAASTITGSQAISAVNQNPDTAALGLLAIGISGVRGLSIGIGAGAPPPAGIGVFGGSGTGPGVKGVSQSGPGARGETTSSVNAAVEGHNSDSGHNAAGVRGTASGNGMGVDGQSPDGAGVSGASANGVGVHAGSLNGVALLAFAPAGQRAIQVGGKAGFSTVGAGSIPAKSSSAFVAQAQVSATSHITVVLTSDPGNAAVVQWVDRAAGSGFTVHLSRGTQDATSFTYFIADTFV